MGFQARIVPGILLILLGAVGCAPGAGPQAIAGPLLSSEIAPISPQTPIPTFCPTATPEPLWVDPVLSPTGREAQTIVVYLGNGEAVTVTCESGTFTQTGSFGAYWPARVKIDLLPDTVHHLRVDGRVRRIEQGGCLYGGYTLSTNRDRYDAPLIIVQRTDLPTSWLPIVLKER